MGRTTHDSTTRDACWLLRQPSVRACAYWHATCQLADCVAPWPLPLALQQHRTPQAVAWVQ